MGGKKRRSYKFTEKKHSKRAIAIWVMAMLTLAAYLAFVFLSYRAAGQLSAYYGGFGVLIMLAAVVVFGLSFTVLNEENYFQLFPRLALITSLLSVFLWIGTYVYGFTAMKGFL